MWYFFQDSLMNRKKEQHLFKKISLCNIINVYTFHFDQLNASSLNNHLYLLKIYILPISNFWSVVYYTYTFYYNQIYIYIYKETTTNKQ